MSSKPKVKTTAITMNKTTMSRMPPLPMRARVSLKMLLTGISQQWKGDQKVTLKV